MGYSGEIDVRPQSSQRRYSTGRASDRPMTRALGTPHRGQTMPEVDLFAIGSSPYVPLDFPSGKRVHDLPGSRHARGFTVTWTTFLNFTGTPLTVAGL
jgi:hypothetical protein